MAGPPLGSAVRGRAAGHHVRVVVATRSAPSRPVDRSSAGRLPCWRFRPWCSPEWRRPCSSRSSREALSDDAPFALVGLTGSYLGAWCVFAGDPLRMGGVARLLGRGSVRGPLPGRRAARRGTRRGPSSGHNPTRWRLPVGAHGARRDLRGLLEGQRPRGSACRCKPAGVASPRIVDVLRSCPCRRSTWPRPAVPTPTRASIPLHLAVNGSLEVGHEVGIVLAGDATELLKAEVRDSGGRRRGAAGPRLFAKARQYDVPIYV